MMVMVVGGVQFGFMLAFLNLFIGFTSTLCLAAFFIFLGATRLPNDVAGTPKRTVRLFRVAARIRPLHSFSDDASPLPTNGRRSGSLRSLASW